VDEGATYKAFGRAVGERRRDLQKTQQEIAALVGLSRASLANIERGSQRVFLHQVLALAEALELTSSHEIVPERGVPSSAAPKADVTVSGARNLSKDQREMVKSLVSTLTSQQRRRT